MDVYNDLCKALIELGYKEYEVHFLLDTLIKNDINDKTINDELKQ